MGLADLPAELLVRIWSLAVSDSDSKSLVHGPALLSTCRAIHSRLRGDEMLGHLVRSLSAPAQLRLWRAMTAGSDLLRRLPRLHAVLQAAAHVKEAWRQAALQPAYCYDRFDLVVLSRGQPDLSDGTSMLFRVLMALGSRNVCAAESLRCTVRSFALLLLQSGADVHAAEEFALQFASANGFLDLVQLLHENGANLHFKRDEAMRWAASRGHVDVVRWLLLHGMNADSPGGEGALAAAAYYGKADVVELLLAAGCNSRASQAEALWQAVMGGNDEVAYKLIDSGASPVSRISEFVGCCVWYGKLTLAASVVMSHLVHVDLQSIVS